MKIEAVITCVNYADFLAETLPHNRVLFDKTVVVTAPEDSATRRVCEFWNVACVPTDVFETRWGRFDKGRAINVGLAELAKTDWVLHLDADIFLPPLTRGMLAAAELDPAFLYGVDRHVCSGADPWRSFLALPQLQHENQTWVHMDKFPVGTRLVVDTGYLPPGFFQLWNAASGILEYPADHASAARTDMQFALQWPRRRRALLPEIVAYHLESIDAAHGSNWNGRKTAHFGAHGTLDPPVAPAGACGPKEPGY